MMASPTPALACTIPDTAMARLSPIIGVIAPITIPKLSPVVPNGSSIPKKEKHHRKVSTKWTKYQT